jgi:hypothetical protein
MASDNDSETSRGFYAAVRDAELDRRVELIRKAKEAVGGRPLTHQELDRLIPAVDCAVTRLRLRNRQRTTG